MKVRYRDTQAVSTCELFHYLAAVKQNVPVLFVQLAKFVKCYELHRYIKRATQAKYKNENE